MAVANYGSYSPQAIDPFQIETTLAKEAITSPAQAQNLLDLYRIQNQTSQGNYNYELDRQHEFAAQQLAATMADNAEKARIEYAKIPGGVGLMNNSSLFAGVPQANRDFFSGQQTRLQNANIANIGSDAAYHLVQAGYPTTPQAVTGITGLPTTQGVPLAIQEAAVRAANAKPETYTVMADIGIGSDGKPIQVPVRIPYGASDDEIKRRIAEATHGATFAPQAPTTGVSGITGPSGGGTSNQPPPAKSGPQVSQDGTVTGGQGNPLLGPLAPGGDGGQPDLAGRTTGKTNLPLAPADEGTQQPGSATAAPSKPATPTQQAAPAQTTAPQAKPGGQVLTDPKIQAQGKMAARLLPDDAKRDVLANSQGSFWPVFEGTDGGLVLVGKSGRTYRP
jgi:hypothetical protein